VADRATRPLRADAGENRRRILAAARDLLWTGDLSVPMRAIADHAGVAPATLYRRFPSRTALASELYAEERRACHAIIATGAADPDPWHGLCSIVEKLYEHHARNRAFVAAFTRAFPDATAGAIADRDASLRTLDDLTRRARDAGALRADFVLDDLMLMLIANRAIPTASTPTRVAASRRFAALTIQALRAPSPAA
jgi:AcrR family transcriptional regulator